MNKTNIQYLTHTWSPIAMRCTPIAAGCKNCRHLKMADRLAKNPTISGFCQKSYRGDSPPVLIKSRLKAPLKKRASGALVGVQFMGDLFYDDVKQKDIEQIFAVMAMAEELTFIVLTKRPDRMKKVVDWRLFSMSGKPKPNVYFGVSVSTQDDLWMVEELLQIPAAVRFVSVEPCLSNIDLTPWLNSDMVNKNHNGGEGYETKRKGVFGAGGNGVVQDQSGDRDNLENGAIDRGQQNRQQALYENAEESQKGRKVHLPKPHENMVYDRSETKNGSICSSDHLDGCKPHGNPGGPGNESQRREPEKQPAGQFGDGHKAGKYTPRSKGSKGYGEEATTRRAKLMRQANGTHSKNDTDSLQRKTASPIQNSSNIRRETGHHQRRSYEKKLASHPGINWLIIGCESINGKPGRECKIEWIESLIQQGNDAGIPVFVKQAEIGGKVISMPEILGRTWEEYPNEMV